MSEFPWLAQQLCSATGLAYYEGPVGGPTLIMLHGVARNHSDWFPVLDQLKRSWHVVLVDHLGHGGSRKFDGLSQSLSSHPTGSTQDTSNSWTHTYSVMHYVSLLSAWLSARNYGPALMLGHSLGAMVSLALAADTTNGLTGIILEDPPFHSMGRNISQGPYQAQFEGMQRVAALDTLSIEERANSLGEVVIPTEQGSVSLKLLRDRASLIYSAQCLASVDPAVFSPLISARWLDGYEPTELWRACSCPVLGMQADPTAGGTWTDGDVELARRECSQLQVVRFKNIGHQIHRTDSARFLASISQFLN